MPQSKLSESKSGLHSQLQQRILESMLAEQH